MNEHELMVIPWGHLLIPQIVNFAVLVGLLVYFLRQPLRNHFAGKLEEFESQKKKAEQAKVEAEEQNQNVKLQLRVLEENSQKNIDDAQNEAKKLREKLLSDARISAAKMLEEAERMTEFEFHRAMAALKVELVTNSIQVSQTILDKAVDKQTQSRLQDEFVEKIQAARA